MPVKDIVAYLGKQKEASKAIEAVERIDKYIDENLANAHDMKDSNPDKKYYRGWDDALGEMARILEDVYSDEKQKESLRDFIDDFPYSAEQKEQKPAEWSEEDEKDMAHIIRILDDCYVYGTHDLSKTDRENLVNKLKSLRPSWKPSEQEKGALRTAISILTEERSFPKAAAHLQAILDAFNGKEARKEWKPSEEQMEALEWLVEYVSPSEKYIVVIKNLYEQLKKL